MIVTGGVNVYPSEVETVIGEHPEVAQVAVIGMPDARWGEAVVAVVRCVPGAASDRAALEQFSRDRLAPYKVPKRWVFARRAADDRLRQGAEASAAEAVTGDRIGTP